MINHSDFALELMEKTGVICSAGRKPGPAGEGFVRFALVAGVLYNRKKSVRLIGEKAEIKFDTVIKLEMVELKLSR